MEASSNPPANVLPPHPKRAKPYVPPYRQRSGKSAAVASPYGEVKNSPMRRVTQASVVLFLVYVVYIAFKGNPAGAIAGAIVNICAMIPALLWVSGKAKGFPIFPIYSFTFVSAFGMQMMQNRALIERIPGELFWISCAAITGFLVVSTCIWYAMVSKPRLPPPSVMAVGGKRSQGVLIAGLIVAAAFITTAAMGQLDWVGTFSTVLRAFMFCLCALSTFILAYDLGLKQLKPVMKTLYLSLVGLVILVHASSFLLVQAMGTALLAVSGYIIASHRIPWKVVIVGIFVMSILHYGKYSMREKYWHDEYVGQIFSPMEYPQMYAEWFGYGFKYFFGPKQFDEERSNLVERSGLLHLFFKIQEDDDTRPLLKGATYAILPKLLVPRFLNKDRAGVHETTSILNIYFGIQSREDTENTTVGWGLFNEAYANFGYFGILMIAIILPLFFGWVTQYSMGCPVTSFQGLVAISVMNVAYQSEFSSGVFVTVLFQTLVALIGLRFIIMQPIKLDRTKIKYTMGGI